MSGDEFSLMHRKLNLIQNEIFMHTIHCLKKNMQRSLYLYIVGGVGVGKSTVIRALNEGLVRYLNTSPSH